MLTYPSDLPCHLLCSEINRFSSALLIPRLSKGGQESQFQMSPCGGRSEERAQQVEGAAVVCLKSSFLPVCCGLGGACVLSILLGKETRLHHIPKLVVNQGWWLWKRDTNVRSVLLKDVHGQAHGGHSTRPPSGDQPIFPTPILHQRLAGPCWWRVHSICGHSKCLVTQ